MANSEEHNKNKHKDAPAVASALMLSGSDISIDIMTILDLNDDIFRDNICSFLDRESIRELMKEDTLSSHFQLCKHFCESHGTCLSTVSTMECHKFKKRRKKRINKSLIADHPGCIDCIMGLDGRIRCEGECKAFKHWMDFGECIKCNREACYECLPLVSCEGCDYLYCRDCFDGFQCSECADNYCHACETMVSCEPCEKAACSECAESLNFIRCDGCQRTLCQDCSPLVCCDCCNGSHCVDCRKGAVLDGLYYCSNCKEGLESDGDGA